MDDADRRLVWSAEGARASHYNASAQVFPESDGGARVVWQADFLPDTIADDIDAALSAGAAAMRKTLDRLAGM